MRFTVTAGEFTRALTAASVNIEPNSTPKFFSGVLVEVKKGAVTLTGVGCRGTVFSQETVTDAEVDTTGKVIVDYKPLLNYITLLDEDDKVAVYANDTLTSLVVKVGTSQPYSFSILTGAEDFPKAPNPKGEETSMTLTPLKGSVAQAGRVTATIHDKQPRLKLVSTSEELILDATDNFRLFRASAKDRGFGDFSWTLPRAEFERVLAQDPVLISWDQHIVKFSTATGFTTFKQMPEDMAIPDASGVVKKDPVNLVEIDSAEFLQKVNRLAAVAPKSNLTLSLGHDCLTLVLDSSAHTGTAVQGEEDVAVNDGPTEQVTAKLSVRYLLDALSAHKGDGTVELGMSSSNEPVRLKSEKDDVTKVNIIMPVRG